ncbi:MAG TPA: PAS domain S-box protein [Methanosarcinaceae archaeon]|nr:PAS domain S-box protein [Methanosarcinaceae archaeon]
MVKTSQLEERIKVLEELQRYNRGLIEASIDPMLTTDNEGIISDVNEQMVNITGHSRKRLIGTPFKVYFTDPGKAYEGIKETLAEKMVRDYELTLISQTGYEIPVSYNATVFTDAEGNVKGVFAIARDMTQYKKMEQEIRESQLYNRTLIESSLDPMLTTDTEAIIIDVNEQMTRITGRSREELIGTPFKDYFTDPERAYKGITKPLAEKMVRDYELTLISDKGKEIPVSSNAAVFTDTNGYVKGVFAVARDMTEHKQLEDKLKRYTENLEVMVEERTEELKIQQEREYSYNQIMTVLNASIDLHTMLTDGLNEIAKHLNAPFGVVYLYDAKNNVLRPAATHAVKKELLTEQYELGEGIPGETALERKTLTIKDIPQDQRYQIEFGIMELTPKNIISIPIVFHKNLLGTILIGFRSDVSNGAQQFLQRVVSQFGIAINNAQSYIMVQNMAQELQEYSGQLEKSNQLKDLFTDILRHDLLNPAGLVRGFTSVLLSMETDEKHKELLNKVHNHNEKLIDLIETASKFAKLENTEELEFERNDIGEIFKNVASTFAPLADKKEMAIEFHTDGEYFANVNPIIEDVFSNLLSNAIKYSPEGSRIIIDIQDDETNWKVSITDFGFGITDDDKTKLFQRFKRVDKKGIKGTGLGLAIVKRIVELHDGNVGIENNPAGQGSVFWITVEKA